jgi:lipid II:glycine glycyltransferase (peptidoglycan interpeptide bridge formation enzyme)
MEDAGATGCGEYALFGIPPNEDPSHPMAGLYRFKTGFGGRIIHRPGSWDYPCNVPLYRLFRWAETLRKNIRTMKKRKRRE